MKLKLNIIIKRLKLKEIQKNKIVAMNKGNNKVEDQKKEENVENNFKEAANNEQEQPKEEVEKQNENQDGPGMLINQPLSNVSVPEQNSEQ